MSAWLADEDSSQGKSSLAAFPAAQHQATLKGWLLCALSPVRASDYPHSLAFQGGRAVGLWNKTSQAQCPHLSPGVTLTLSAHHWLGKETQSWNVCPAHSRSSSDMLQTLLHLTVEENKREATLGPTLSARGIRLGPQSFTNLFHKIHLGFPVTTYLKACPGDR